MADKVNSSKAKQIKVLLGVLTSGLGFGILIASATLYRYNPSGSYQANNVLLDPENTYTLRFVEPGPKGKSEGKYIFEGMYFTHFDSNTRQQSSVNVSKEKYAAFYNLIGKESSIVEPGVEIVSLFNRNHPAFLALKVRPLGEDLSKGIEQTFSRIEFVDDGDYYRVQLRQSAPGAEWIYFNHPKIYQEAHKIFSQTHD